ncbi:uncharacterized protein LOC132592654 [Zootoca vivipara]|uniref:uncharacterized protein LOC132592654 n=1 Tax=Zootoca vivipara TaxID=8524 RepID=UPI00293BC9DA|nr:uncharacterized protein LOC132592654 [Zootoca vivipara]
MPNASSTPLVVPAAPSVQRRREGKQPRRPRKRRPATGGVGGVGQATQAGASTNVVISPYLYPRVLLWPCGGMCLQPPLARMPSQGRPGLLGAETPSQKAFTEACQEAQGRCFGFYHLRTCGRAHMDGATFHSPWTGLCAAETQLGLQLGLPSNIHVTWMGKRGMRWGETPPFAAAQSPFAWLSVRPGAPAGGERYPRFGLYFIAAPGYPAGFVGDTDFVPGNRLSLVSTVAKVSLAE